MSAPSNAVRVVVDITGGSIHAVYAGQPVEIVFISSDKDDIADEFQEEAGYQDMDGQPVAIYTQGCPIGDGAAVVEHYFTQSSNSCISRPI